MHFSTGENIFATANTIGKEALIGGFFVERDKSKVRNWSDYELKLSSSSSDSFFFFWRKRSNLFRFFDVTCLLF